MRAAGLQSSTRSETRLISPYSAPIDRNALLKLSTAEIGDRTYSDGDFIVVDKIEGSSGLQLKIVVDGALLEKLIESWQLQEDDLALVVIYEEKLLWDLDLMELPISSMERVGPGRRLEVDVPRHVLAVSQEDRLVIRVYLALSKSIARPVQDSPSDRGAIVSSWAITLGGPEEQQWWTINLLNDETLERLNANRKIKVYKKAFVFVETEELLMPGDLSERVSVYLNEDVAAQLQTSRVTAVVDAVFYFVGSEVIASILAGMRSELAQMGEPFDLPEDAAILPFVEKVADTLQIDKEEVISLIRRDGEDLTALKSNLQRIVPLADSVKKMLKGLNS